ncbi:SprT-like domain-containing protein [Spectribacter hydrogenooxidans]|uniref:SprT-like domain-containing protein n=1 Tax=Spectribacter hydrogenoxidans TaxID=3075608 RepID=A0ABU3C019_9GAMM|nr:SprT-like domain-containing protein [Salinisphaera sp. W335]MDT0634901.1 SprT-like domain-containing protein [Salinisphaera sp. W335]
MTQQAAASAIVASETALVDAVAYWVARANSLFDLAVPVPQVRMDLRGRSAGLTVYARRHRQPALIRFNAGLCEQYPAEMLNETVPHEVAHVVTVWRHGFRVKPHGPEWRAIMVCFDRPPTVCHRMDAPSSRAMRYFPYRCCCDEPRYLSAIRHRRAGRGAAYLCRRCGSRLVATGGVPVVSSGRT